MIDKDYKRLADLLWPTNKYLGDWATVFKDGGWGTAGDVIDAMLDLGYEFCMCYIKDKDEGGEPLDPWLAEFKKKGPGSWIGETSETGGPDAVFEAALKALRHRNE